MKHAFTAWGKLDDLDVQILEALSIFGPRNIQIISRALGIPRSTVNFRIKKMIKNKILYVHVSPYHTNLGLKKMFIFIKPIMGLENELLDALKILKYYIYLFRFYRPYEGVGGIYAIPKNLENNFFRYLNELCKMGFAESYEYYWTTCLHAIKIYSKWYDEKDGIWKIFWNKFLEDLENVKGELPEELVEPSDWVLKADKIDLLIIKELEKNGFIPFTKLSKMLNIPLKNLYYHWKEHILKRKLIESFQIEVYKYPFNISELLLFKFNFENYEQTKKFILTLMDKPFVLVIGKELYKNSVFCFTYMPKIEFRRFIDILSYLIKINKLKSYDYYIIDMWKTHRETIQYDYPYFVDGEWRLDVDLFINKLKFLRDKIINKHTRKFI